MLAAGELTADQYQRIIWASLIVVGLIIAAFVVVIQVRRRLNQADDPTSGGTGFTLADLRQLHKSGQMTDAEFEAAKSKIVEAARRASDRDAAAASSGAAGAGLRERRQARAGSEVESNSPPPPGAEGGPPSA